MSVSGHDLARNMSFEIVGREEDRASVEAFVGRAEGGASALVLEGEAGIGKSTLWLAGVEVARSQRAPRPLCRDRPRPSAASLTRGWATCSRVSSGRRPFDLAAEAACARGRAPT